eukprot:12521536-Ditylum_brightwellii.AAC.1
MKIAEQIGLTPDVKVRESPVCIPLLHKNLDGLKCKWSWYSRSAVGMLSYLQGTSCPEIAMGVHQCARLTNRPMLSHEHALQQIVKYLNTTADRGIVYDPNPNIDTQCYVDADFDGSWSKEDADNTENVMLRTGFVIMYAVCLALWQSKLQTEITLSTAEAEYLALSSAMHKIISFIIFLEELSK